MPVWFTAIAIGRGGRTTDTPKDQESACCVKQNPFHDTQRGFMAQDNHKDKEDKVCTEMLTVAPDSAFTIFSFGHRL